MRHCGVLNIDKPAGITSREVVDRIVKLVRPAKVGHAGTLDPLATGLLVVCVGHATRLINLIQEGRKRYRARFVLGQRSDTDDITGNITPGGDWSQVTIDCLKGALPEFTGRIMQVPPQFSAVHIQGRRAYDLARQGHAVEINARPVDVFSLHVTDYQPPEFELDIECGSGTYIRSIGRDLGLKFGCGAVMTQLRRTTVGTFDISEALPLNNVTLATWANYLQPALTVVSDWPQRFLTIDEVIAVRRGQTISNVNASTEQPPILSSSTQSDAASHRIALIGVDLELLGIGEINEKTNRIQPRIVFPADP